MVGRVVSTKMLNTAAVLVDSTKTHPLYKKSFTVSKKFLADDPLGVKAGDIVQIEKIRPISKRKHWKVVKVLGRRIEEIVEEQLKEEVKEAIAEVMPKEKVEEPSDASSQTEEKKEDQVKEKPIKKRRDNSDSRKLKTDN